MYRRGSHARLAKLQLEALEPRRLLAASLVHDFNTNPADGLPPLSTLGKVHDEVYFAGNNGSNIGWRTDGTAIGTVPTLHRPSADLGDTLLFFEGNQLLAGSDPDGSLTLLKDGAAVAFTDFFGHGNPVWNNELYFRGFASSEGYELWKTDGTAANTVRVKDIRTGTQNSDVRTLTPAANYLFFLANDGTSTEVWRTDGTENGTARVTNFPNATTAGDPSDLTAVGDTLYFRADDGVDSQALWKVVGAGIPEKIKGPLVDAGSPTAVGNYLFFTMPSANTHSQSDNHDLWRTDGTAAGTIKVQSFPNNTGLYWTTFLGSHFLAVDNDLYFTAYDELHGYELWRSDGTPAGTQVLSETLPGGAIGLIGEPRELTRVGNDVFFVFQAGELWKSDGTPQGTVLVKTCDDLGTSESYPQDLVELGGKLLFIGYDFSMGLEPCVSDGTAAGTHVLKDTRPGTTSSRPEKLTVAGDKLYLQADDYVVDLDSNDRDPSVWMSDGNTAARLPFAYDVAAIASLGNDAIVATPFQSSRLYKFNGVPGETEYLGDVYATRLRTVGPKVFGTGFNLYVTDGTAGGTTILGNGVFNTSYGGMAALGDLLIFTGDDATGTELWRSDGTEAGTFQLGDINPGAASGIGGSFDTVVLNGYLYFMANDGGSNYRLWRTDGTVEGTTLFKDIYPGHPSFPSKFVSAGSSFYFRASSQDVGSELWKSDGTEAGTVLVKDIYAGSESSNPDNLTMVGSTLFFTAQTSSGTPQLWKSDGTPDGTVMVTPALWQGTISKPIAVGDRFVFVAYTAAAGSELWQSDGTAAGTFPLADVYPGARSSDPDSLVVYQNQLYFLAEDGFHGRELFRIDPNPPRVLDVINVSPDPRATSVATVDVTLSKPLDLATFTFADLQLTRNGANVPLSNVVTIAYQGAGQYRVGGLQNFTWQGGTYKLTVNSAGLKDDLGQVGTGTASDEWTTDTTNLGGNLNCAENAPAVLVSSSAVLNSDPSLNYSGATLKLAISSPAALDRLTIRNGASVTAFSGKVFKDGVEIATYAGGSGIALTIIFNADSTRGLLQEVLRQIEFSNLSDRPPNSARTMTITVQDNAALTIISKKKMVQITLVNDAPVLTAGPNPILNAIVEDAPNPPGTLVSAFASPRIEDPDTGALKGIAVIGLTEKLYGSWQYSADGGTTWLALGNPSDTAARLLTPSYRVRFLPSPNYNGMPQLVFRAWDQSDGKAAGSIMDTTGHRGRDGACSESYLSARLIVSPVNDKPVLTLSGTVGYVRNAAPVVLAPNATVFDDSSDFDGGLLSVYIGANNNSSNRLAIGGGFGVDASNNVNLNGVTIGRRTSDGVGTNWLLVKLNSKATKSIVQQLMRSITFASIGGTWGQRTVAFSVSDGDGGLSEVRTKTVNVT